MRNPKLKPWLDSGIRRFAQYGLKGLNVKEMAQEINIATSSFYHYFNTKEEYLEQLLEYWHEEGSMKIIEEVFLEDEPEEALKLLFNIVFNKGFIFESFLLQLRAASLDNEMFSSRVLETDKIRTTFLAALFARTGLKEKESRQKATQVYIYMVGVHAYNNLVPMKQEEKDQYIEGLKEIFGIDLRS